MYLYSVNSIGCHQPGEAAWGPPRFCCCLSRLHQRLYLFWSDVRPVLSKHIKDEILQTHSKDYFQSSHLPLRCLLVKVKTYLQRKALQIHLSPPKKGFGFSAPGQRKHTFAFNYIISNTLPASVLQHTEALGVRAQEVGGRQARESVPRVRYVGAVVTVPVGAL